MTENISPDKRLPKLGIDLSRHKLSIDTKEKSLFQTSVQEAYSILWFKRGEGKYCIDFMEYPFKPETLVIVSKHQVCHFVPPIKKVDFLSLSFTDRYVNGSKDEIIKMLSFCMREHFEGKQILELDPGGARYLTGIIEQMELTLQELNEPYQVSALFHLMQLLLIYCFKIQQAQIHTRQTMETDALPDAVGKFTTLLEQQFKSNQKVNYYSDNLFLTYNTLAKHTKSYCGKTPKEIIEERVMLEAKRMLVTSTKPVKEIALDLGFEDPTNLVKYFKKNEGTTPSTFRQAHRLG